MTFEAMEIGLRGYVDKASKTRIKNILKLCECSSVKSREFIQELSKLALTASFVVFYSRKDQLWGTGFNTSHFNIGGGGGGEQTPIRGFREMKTAFFSCYFDLDK